MNKNYVRLSMALLFTSFYASGQIDSTALPDITINENRIELTVNASGRSIAVLSKKDIRSLPGQTPNDWLGTLSGVDIRQRGPVGVQADIGIRGGSFDQSLVLLNGMKLSDPQTGHHMLNLPMTNEAIEQIEVVKGAASRMYGINALTGSVNIITKVPEQNCVFGGVFGGDFGLYGAQAGVVFHSKSIGHHLSFSRMASNGYKPNTDFKTNNFFYQATLKAGKGKLNLTSGYTTRDFGAAGFYVANSSEFEMTKTAFGGLQYELKINRWTIKSQVYYRYNDDEYIYLREKPDVFRNHHFSHVAGVELHATYTSEWGQTGMGIDTRSEQLASNNLGNQTRNIGGLFAEHRVRLLHNKLNITPGIYITAYSGNNTAAFPGIDASYLVHNKVYLFASADKGLRLPTFTDLYYKGPSNIGNPDLKAEQAINTEIGLKYTDIAIFVSASAFNRQSSNLIDWARPDATQKWQPQNLNDVIFRGIELAARKSFKGLIGNVSTSYTYIDAQFNQPQNYTSRYTLSNIRHQMIGSIRFNWYKNLYQTVTIRHVNRVAMTDYTLIDSKLAYAFKHLNLYAEVSNILNTNYMEAGYVTMPGSWAKVGIDIKLNYEASAD
jgi:vitamin B12 transporter